MTRKTIDVGTVKDSVNRLLATTKGDSAEDIARRRGMMYVLEDILFETGNYRGFQYLDSTAVPAKNKPGIRNEYANPDDKFVDTDNSRVQYY